MNDYEAMEARHSVRQYLNKPIEEEKRQCLQTKIEEINQLHHLNIQIFFDEPECFNARMARYGKFSGVTNYICLIGPKSDTLDETLGYYGEELVLTTQKLGINTCWVAMSHGKSAATLGKGEKEVCLIALGYGSVSGVMHKSKAIENVCNYNKAMPQWFLDGVKAALLAPTAMNQQKFYFCLKEDNLVEAKSGMGFYTKLDLGIAKYHFELGAQRKI